MGAEKVCGYPRLHDESQRHLVGACSIQNRIRAVACLVRHFSIAVTRSATDVVESAGRTKVNRQKARRQLGPWAHQVVLRHIDNAVRGKCRQRRKTSRVRTAEDFTGGKITPRTNRATESMFQSVALMIFRFDSNGDISRGNDVPQFATSNPSRDSDSI